MIGLTMLIAVALPSRASAATQFITPEIVSASSQVEQALKENKGRASLSLEGKGGYLSLQYAASEPMKIYAVPLDAKGSYVPTDFLVFSLPAATENTVLIDLTVSPGWTPKNHTWKINALTEHENVAAEFLTVDFIPASPIKEATTMFNQLFTPEAYTPSTFHALRGYRVFATPVVPILGILTLITALILALKNPRQSVRLCVLVFVSGSLLYQARFAVDLIRFSYEHLTEYRAGTYDEAGSVYEIAKTLEAAPTTSTVYVCRDGTNYKEKILRYMVYPLQVSSQDEDAKNAAYAVVMNKFDWTYETVLNCGVLKRPATKIKDYPDGSVLFSLAQP